jgi:hypothetical protein
MLTGRLRIIFCRTESRFAELTAYPVGLVTGYKGAAGDDSKVNFHLMVLFTLDISLEMG